MPQHVPESSRERFAAAGNLLQLPKPLDDKILGGVAIYDAVGKDEVHALMERLDESFEVMRRDRTDEYGACLAYCIGISSLDMYRLDTAIKEGVERQHDGLLRRIDLEPQAGIDHTLWAGYDGRREFAIHRITPQPVAMSDGTAPEGTVYSLLGRRAI